MSPEAEVEVWLSKSSPFGLNQLGTCQYKNTKQSIQADNWFSSNQLDLVPKAQSTQDEGCDACKFERFSFDVACVQCGHPHSHRQIPFACVALRITSHVLCGLGLNLNHSSTSASEDTSTSQPAELPSWPSGAIACS